jgi:hypothetical protein
MKIRIEKALLVRARVCADEVDATLSKWANLAIRHYRDGKLDRVAAELKSKNATRSGSVVCTLPGTQDEADDMRAALESAVQYCESKRPPAFKTDLVAGRDYVVVKELESGW